MAQLKEIRDRINSIQGTQKITGAMYMIATTKLRHAKENRDNNAVYFAALKNLMERLLRHLPESDHPYLRVSDKPKEEQVHGYLMITGDKGLAGAYNQNIHREADRLMAEDGGKARIFVVGDTGRRYFRNHNIAIDEDFEFSSGDPTHHLARMIRSYLLQLFRDGEIDDLRIIYTAMKSAMEAEVRVRQLLPVKSSLDVDLSRDVPKDVYNEEFIFSPSPDEVIRAVVPNYMNGYIYSALIESFCAEQNSRMLAMQTASDAASTMIKDLNVQYNRARQGVITQEITEVSAGAEALSGV
ncbi:MAG: ATP synthase F1 subunit gamma [Lachnospiraceae bacterium]|nr:ATP synthase F1 subunit gamma [Lachnospiraceae bacterium]